MARPPREIDWAEVELRMQAGCNGMQISAALGIHEDTFYARYKEYHGESFSDSAAKSRSHGNSNLLTKQYTTALKGNVPMLLHLGKHRLGQVDKKENSDSEISLEQFNAFMDMFKALRKESSAKEPEPQKDQSDLQADVEHD